MGNCNHTRQTSPEWVEYECDWTGETVGYWEEGGAVSTTVDVDMHRYRCTQCGEVMYYSAAAKRHYEEGEENIVSHSIQRNTHNGGESDG